MDRVFVSYRRSDAEFLVAELQPRLAAELDADVFFDLQSIFPGGDWEAEITAALKRISVFVLLLGRDWVGMLASGKRRIDEDEDVFRLEIERALDSTATIIPVLLGDVAAPEVSELPERLRRIAKLQAVTIDSKHMESSVSTLIAAIRRGLDSAQDARLGGGLNFGDGLEPRHAILDWSIDPPAVFTDGRPRVSMTSVSAQLKLAIDSALVTTRPLLLVGATSKDRHEVGENIARRLESRYYEFYCTERTTSQDFIYTFDQTRRLADAQVAALEPTSSYVEPGVLWWAFDAESARKRGAFADNQIPDLPASDPDRLATDPSRVGRDTPERTVVAIHNLDRLEPFQIETLFTLMGTRSFVVTELSAIIAALASPHIILDVQRIRAVPRWIRQQCVVGRLHEPSINELASSAKLWMGEEYGVPIDQVAEALNADLAITTLFGTIDAATFVDLVKAVLKLDIKPGGATWRVLLDTFGVE